MIKAKLNGKTLSIETRWDDLSFKKFMGLTRAQLADPEIKTAEILAVLLEMPAEVIAKAKFEGLDSVIAALEFLYDQPELNEAPTKLGPWRVPSFNEATVEQYEMLRAEIRKASTKTTVPEQNEHLPVYAAIFMQPIVDGELTPGGVAPFDYEKATYLAQKFYSYSCVEVMSVGAFFMLKGLNLMPNSPKNYHLPPIVQKKRKRASSVSMKRSVSMLRWIRSRGTWGQRIKRFFAGQFKSSTPS